MAPAVFTERLLGSQRGPGIGRPLTLALLVHVALVAALVVSVRWTKPPVPTMMRAVVMTEAEAPPREADKRKREDAARRNESDRRQKEDIRARTQEAERQAEEAKKKKATEEKRKKMEAAKRRQKDTERALKEQIVAEDKSREEAAREARAGAEVDRQVAVIRQKVERNWNRPPGLDKSPSCIVRVRLVPGGEVLAATVVRGSGNALFDRSVENAVYKASPLPLPADPELFEYFREIEFLFNPKE
jgi:colicin import membrane protein